MKAALRFNSRCLTTCVAVQQCVGDHVIITRVRVTCTGKLNGSASWRLVVIAGCGAVIVTVSKVVPSAHRSWHHLSRHCEHVLILLVEYWARLAVVHECIGIMHSVIFFDDFPITLGAFLRVIKTYMIICYVSLLTWGRWFRIYSQFFCIRSEFFSTSTEKVAKVHYTLIFKTWKFGLC